MGGIIYEMETVKISPVDACGDLSFAIFRPPYVHDPAQIPAHFGPLVPKAHQFTFWLDSVCASFGLGLNGSRTGLTRSCLPDRTV